MSFELLFEKSPVPLLALAPDPNFTILAVTDGYVRATGRPRHGLVGRSITDAPPAGAELRDSLETTLTSREPNTMAIEKVGERHWRPTNTPILGKDRDVEYIVHQLEDVTELVRIAERGAAETAELEAIFRSIPDAIYVGNTDGIWRANDVALRQLGFESLEQLNRDIATLASEIQTRRADTGELIPAEGQAFTHALQGHADVQEVRVRDRRTGVERVVRSSCAPILVNDRPLAAVALNVDITQTKAAETSLRARADFEQQLIAIVSHDLRSPLQTILISAGASLHDHGHDERTLKSLIRIEGAAERSTRLVNDLLDFTQARLGGGIPIEPRPVDLDALIRQAVEEVQSVHADRTIELRTSDDVHGRYDPDRVAQIVTNLVGNAVKYSPRDSTVTVTSRARDGIAVLEVHNVGTPIPEEMLGRIFEPMQRGTRRPDPAHRSVGLGLYIVDHLVRAHGGTVDVKSTVEDGTTFTVRLPMGSSIARSSDRRAT